MRMSGGNWRNKALFDIDEFPESGPVPDRLKHADQKFIGNTENGPASLSIPLNMTYHHFCGVFFLLFLSDCLKKQS